MRQGAAPARRGFSLIELVLVMLIMGVVAGLALPKLRLGGFRVDAAAQQVRFALQTAQRTALTRQYNVIVSFDTLNARLRVTPDADNSGTVDPGEVGLWRPLGADAGTRFAVPATGFSTPTVTNSVGGSALARVGGLPSIVFHRDGSASSDLELYLLNRSRGRDEFRLVTVTRSTGRTDTWRLAGTGAKAAWQVVR